ncbi:hypothetical protein SeMB42_g02842 [Synchytrium endobioticum]|uniref:MYND-type domain-containing protein n=1 Tax=Synchytrium endobioticum TaxID=286115 RepID=A0A507DD68_9FUNG|nr:hypothetical protein SeMB42_g02842 [Synchytrium endobioticum]
MTQRRVTRQIANITVAQTFKTLSYEQGHAINVNPEVPREEQQITVIIVTSDTLDFVQPLDLIINGVTNRHRRQDMDFSVATIFNVTSQVTISIEKADRLDPVLASYWNSSVAPDSRAPKRYLVDIVLAVSGDITLSKTHTELENFERLQESWPLFAWAFRHLVVDNMWGWESSLQPKAQMMGNVSSSSATHKLFRRGQGGSTHPKPAHPNMYGYRKVFVVKKKHPAKIDTLIIKHHRGGVKILEPSMSAGPSQEVPQEISHDHRETPQTDFVQAAAQFRHVSQHYVATGQHTSPGNFHRVSRSDAHTQSAAQSAGCHLLVPVAIDSCEPVFHLLRYCFPIIGTSIIPHLSPDPFCIHLSMSTATPPPPSTDRHESLQVFDNPFPPDIWPHILNIAVKSASSASTLIATCKLFADEVPRCARFKAFSVTDQRRAVLEGQLKTKSLKLRKDSRLCKEYIEDGVGDLPYIVQVMEEMSWYHEATNYKRVKFKDVPVPPSQSTTTVLTNPPVVEDWYDWSTPDPPPSAPRPVEVYVKPVIDSEGGKKIAQEAWIDYHLQTMHRYVFAHELDGGNRPPASLWAALNEGIGRRVWPLLTKVVREEKVRRILDAEAASTPDVERDVNRDSGDAHDGALNSDKTPDSSLSPIPIIVTNEWQMTPVPDFDTPDPERPCATCGVMSTSHLRCGGCKVVFYCNRNCQKEDWKAHKAECKNLHKIGQPSVNIKTNVASCSADKIDYASLWEQALEKEEAGRNDNDALLGGSNNENPWDDPSIVDGSAPRRQVSDDEVSQVKLRLDELYELFESRIGSNGRLSDLVHKLMRRGVVTEERLMELL